MWGCRRGERCYAVQTVCFISAKHLQPWRNHLHVPWSWLSVPSKHIIWVLCLRGFIYFYSYLFKSYVAEGDHELTMTLNFFLLTPRGHWGRRHVAPHLVHVVLGIKRWTLWMSTRLYSSLFALRIEGKTSSV